MRAIAIQRRIVDAHCHLHEFTDDEVKAINTLGIDVIAVSDDYSSSIRTLAIAKEYTWIIPAIGVHPWSIRAEGIEEAHRVIELALDKNVRIRMLGEVGLDRKFRPETFAYQLQVFKLFIEVAKEIKAVLNVHAAGAWREVIDILVKSDIPMAVIHWYTGPPNLLNELSDRGFYITINPAVFIQQKHKEIAALAPMDIILVESDAPYSYKGLVMHPRNIFDVIGYIANLRGISIEEAYEIISYNYEKLKSKYFSL